MNTEITAEQTATHAAIIANKQEANQRAQDLLAWQAYTSAEPFASARMRQTHGESIERGRTIAEALPPTPPPAPPPPPPGTPSREEYDQMTEPQRARTRLAFPHFYEEKTK